MISVRHFELSDFDAVAMAQPEHAELIVEIRDGRWFEADQDIWSRTLVDAAGQVAAIGGLVPVDGSEGLVAWAFLTDIGRKYPLGVTRATRLVLDLAEYVPDSEGLCQRDVFDPACGSGAFVVTAAARLLQHLSLDLPCHKALLERARLR